MVGLAQARHLLKRAMETQGRDFIYNPGRNGICHYVPHPHSRGPQRATGCLIGVALTMAGETRHQHIAGTVYTLAAKYRDMMTPEAVDYFHEAQNRQDRGSSWGEAYDAAEASLIPLAPTQAGGTDG